MKMDIKESIQWNWKSYYSYMPPPVYSMNPFNGIERPGSNLDYASQRVEGIHSMELKAINLKY